MRKTAKGIICLAVVGGSLAYINTHLNQVQAECVMVKTQYRKNTLVIDSTMDFNKYVHLRKKHGECIERDGDVCILNFIDKLK